MDIKDILSKVDHTLLNPKATWEEIKNICDDGMKYSTASLDVRDVQDLLQALQWEPDRVSAFWPDLCDACRTLYRLSGEQLDIYVRLTQPAYAADLHLVEPDTLPPS